jgi:hypothetical protein
MKPLKVLFFALAFLLLYSALLWLFSVPSMERQCIRLVEQPSLAILEIIFPRAQFGSEVNINNTRSEFKIGVTNRQKAEKYKQLRQQGAEDLPTLAYKGRKFYLDTLLIPFLLFICLSLLTSVDWKPKVINILLGTLLLWFFFLFRIFLFIRMEMGIADLGIYTISESTYKLLSILTKNMELGFLIFLAVFLWLSLVFPKSRWYGDLKQLLNKIN